MILLELKQHFGTCELFRVWDGTFVDESIIILEDL
jgi:hypothetical protein